MPTAKRSEQGKVQTTLRLPKPIYDEARRILNQRPSGIDSFNDLVVAALRSFLRRARRRQIDLAFRGMAEDAGFQKEAQLIAKEFEQSDWEALELGEKL